MLDLFHQRVGRFRSDRCRIDDFRTVVEVETRIDDFPLADRIDRKVLIYSADRLRAADRLLALDELVLALSDGPGIVVMEDAFDPAVVDRATEVYAQVIADQHRSGEAAGDHFAAPGANDRIWNSLEKLALADPDLFIDYFSNDMLALGAEAWLGPDYQMTAQVNLVHPGGTAQDPHRDYHLGFMSDDQAARFPAHVHRMSPLLTLQGALAHCDMPVESGPTTYLPNSQKYDAGYLAWRRPEFKQYFADNLVQLPLSKGDLVYFNPALFHAAGSNTTADVERMANLFQVCSALTRAMESIDRSEMIRAVYPRLAARLHGTGPAPIDSDIAARAVAACADGYPFPADLDRDQPVGGLAPPSQADLVTNGLAERWTLDRLIEHL